MNQLGTILTKLPLLLKVVVLYVMVGTPIWFSNVVFSTNQDVIPTSTRIVTRTYTPKTPPAAPISGKPARIVVPRLGIDLAVTDGTYNASSDTWTLSEDKAQFATMTDRPNNISGMTFVYGHNTDAVFARLSGLKKGDTVRLTTSNKHTFTYVYGGQQIVQPTDTQILASSSDKPRLTLMTCEGIFSQTRRVMFFDFKEVT